MFFDSLETLYNRLEKEQKKLDAATEASKYSAMGGKVVVERNIEKIKQNIFDIKIEIISQKTKGRLVHDNAKF